MKKNLKKVSIIFISLVLIVVAFAPYVVSAFQTQVVFEGDTEENEKDGVTVSKKITETNNGKENYFDIELTVKTETEVSKITVPPSDIAIVLVIDASSSMTWCMDSNDSCGVGSRRIDYLKDALLNEEDGFLIKFKNSADEARRHDGDIKRELGIVKFNDEVHSGYTVDLTDYDADTFMSTFKPPIENITTRNGTNPAPALKIAGDMLRDSGAANKYIIFLTDGYPTLHYKGTADAVYNKTSGGNLSTAVWDYDDTGAYYARRVANDNKESGIKTYSIGVGVGGQYTIINGSTERRSNIASYSGQNYKYEVGYETKKETVYTFSGINNLKSTDNVVITSSNSSTANAMFINKSSDGVVDGKISNVLAENSLWNIISSGSQYVIKNVSTGKYIGVNSSNNVILVDDINDAQKFTAGNNNLSFKKGSTTYYLGRRNTGTYYNQNYEWTINTNSTNLYFGKVSNGTKDVYITGPNQFKAWLGGAARDGANISNPKRGIGYVTEGQAYYDVSDGDGLAEAYEEIFANIEQEIQKISSAWIVSDPMNNKGAGVSTGDYIEFVNFYDVEGNVLSDDNGRVLFHKNDLNDGVADNDFSFANDTISWNLRESDPIATETSGNKTIYTYKLKYRVRLKNEIEGFKEKSSDTTGVYETNGLTNLNYVIVTKDSEGNSVVGDPKNIVFPNPKVKGYLGEFSFEKVSGYDGKPLKDAVFKLSLDKDSDINNSYFNGEYASIDSGYYLTATSVSDGTVSFKNIPSGYEYILEEVSAPAGYTKDNNKYKVSVLNNVVTVQNNLSEISNNPNLYELTIKKQIDTKGQIDTDKVFNFKILVTDSKENVTSYVADNEEGKISVTKKDDKYEGTFTLKHNDEITITLPFNTSYEIIELDDTSYNPSYDDNKTGSFNSSTISKIVDNKVETTITNTKKPREVNAIKKWENITGYVYLPKVRFILERSLDNTTWEAAGNACTVESTITSSEVSSSSCKWSDLDGDYEYRVKEDKIAVNSSEQEELDHFVNKVTFDKNSNQWVITNINTQTYELPEAGSSGMLILIIIGIFLLGTPVIYIVYDFYERKYV